MKPRLLTTSGLLCLPLLLVSCGGSESPAPTAEATSAEVATAKAAAARATRKNALPNLQAAAGLGDSHAMGLWKPNLKYDTCPQSLHDSIHVVAPDGLRYPTWHAPTTIDPATGKECSFGHEHGRDPKDSALWGWIQEHFAFDANGDGRIDEAEKAVAGLPFGYVNESLDKFNLAQGITNGMRHEDHVGHKVEWENAVSLQRNACDTVAQPGCYQRVDIGVQCDFLMKPHQGTHSPDAFTNNMHELVYAVQCRNTTATGEAAKFGNTKLIAAKMVLFGKPGFFQPAGGFNGQPVYAGQCTPANSGTGNGTRLIPAMSVIDPQVLVKKGSWSNFGVLYEDWLSSNYIGKADGSLLAYFDPHIAVFSPSRFYWPEGGPSYGIQRTPEDLVARIGRSSDLCYARELDASGRVVRKARGVQCDLQTSYGQTFNSPIPWDSPKSQFNGTHREMYINQTQLTNPGGPELWYSDPFGRQAVGAAAYAANPQAYAGFIRQYVAGTDNRMSFNLESISLGSSRDYSHPTVHAPN